MDMEMSQACPAGNDVLSDIIPFPKNYLDPKPFLKCKGFWREPLTQLEEELVDTVASGGAESLKYWVFVWRIIASKSHYTQHYEQGECQFVKKDRLETPNGDVTLAAYRTEPEQSTYQRSSYPVVAPEMEILPAASPFGGKVMGTAKPHSFIVDPDAAAGIEEMMHSHSVDEGTSAAAYPFDGKVVKGPTEFKVSSHHSNAMTFPIGSVNPPSVARDSFRGGSTLRSKIMYIGSDNGIDHYIDIEAQEENPERDNSLSGKFKVWANERFSIVKGALGSAYEWSDEVMVQNVNSMFEGEANKVDVLAVPFMIKAGEHIYHIRTSELSNTDIGKRLVVTNVMAFLLIASGLLFRKGQRTRFLGNAALIIGVCALAAAYMLAAVY